MNVSVVVPVFNEIDSIRLLYEELKEVFQNQAINQSYELIFVDDGSTDGSADALDEIAASDKDFKVIHFRRNYGQSAALLAGIRHSIGRKIVLLDADLQNDPADIPRLLTELGNGFDVVSGWRRERKDNLLTRIMPSRIANWIISKITKVKLHDYGCTLKAYNKEILVNLDLYGEMHRFIPVYAAWEGAKVGEIPVNHRPRMTGVSKYGISRVPRVLLDVFLVFFLDRAFDRPIQFFGKIGFYCFGLAFLTGLWAIFLKYFNNQTFIETPLPLLVVLLTITGILFVLLGLLAEIQIRTYFQSAGRPPYSLKSKRNFLDEK
ncbi:glycosyltransferase family 2 protein [Nitrospinota bacterium]